MNVTELSREQLVELKQYYICDKREIECEESGEKYSTPSYSELVLSKNIPDDVIFEYYEGVIFSEDDFFCSAN